MKHLHKLMCLWELWELVIRVSMMDFLSEKWFQKKQQPDIQRREREICGCEGGYSKCVRGMIILHREGNGSRGNEESFWVVNHPNVEKNFGKGNETKRNHLGSIERYESLLTTKHLQYCTHLRLIVHRDHFPLESFCLNSSFYVSYRFWIISAFFE